MKSKIVAVTVLVLGFCALTASAAQASLCVGQFTRTSSDLRSPTCVSACCLCQLVKNAAASPAYNSPAESLFYGQTYNKIAAINALFAEIQRTDTISSSCVDPCILCASRVVEPPIRRPPRPIVLPQPELIDPSVNIPVAKYTFEAERKE